MSKMMKLLNKAEEIKQASYSANSLTSADKTHASDTVSSFSKLFMLIAASVAVASLGINFQAVHQIKQERILSQQLLSDLNSQKNKMEDLEVSLSSIKENEKIQINQLVDQLALTNEHLASKEHELQELVIDQNILKLLVNDLKINNRLLLDKTISLSEGVRELGSQISEEERKL